MREGGLSLPRTFGCGSLQEVTSMVDKDGKHWIDRLRLERHPEGGYFRQTYRSDVVIAREALPIRFGGARQASTGIFFLLDGRLFGFSPAAFR